MAQGQPLRGELTATTRSYQQDAENAMGSDPIRAIVELVTNADDAYEEVAATRKGKIRIEWERRRKPNATILRVRDRARGMTRAEIEERLGTLGGRTSGFEAGERRRGLLGRGAKDVVHFGPVAWESKRAGEHTRFAIEYDSGATNRWELEQLPPSGPRETGTTVTLEIQPRFRIPREATLLESLRRHYALRPILEDRRGRELTLNSAKIVYEQPRGELLADRVRVPIAGNEGHECVVTLRECRESLDDNVSWEYWRHSLLVTSGRAAYEVFQGGRFARGRYAPYLARLFGSVDAPGINRLIRAYDDAVERGQTPPPENPIRLVRRDRYGLVERSDHPYVNALYEAIESLLEPHLERLRQEAEQGSGVRQSERLRRRFDRVSVVLNEYLDELEAEGEGGGGHLPEPGLTVIPELRVAEPGEPGRLSVRYRPAEPLHDPPVATLALSDEDGEHPPVELSMSAQAGGAYFTCTHRSPGRDEGAVSALRVSVDGAVAEGLIEWRRLPEAEPVDAVQFDSASYSVRDGARRVARLLAPWDMVAASEAAPRFELHGDPGLQLLNPAAQAVFGYDEALRAGACPVTVRGSGVGARARIVARLGEQVAEAELRVTTAAASGIRPQIDEFDVPQRAWLDGAILKVNARDPSVRAYLGPKREHWPGLETPHFNVLLAEILASTVVRHRLQAKYLEPYDAARLFGEYQSDLGKLLPRVHAALVPAADRRAVEPWRHG